MRLPVCLFPILLIGTMLTSVLSGQEKKQFPARQLEHFEKKIRPLLAARCYKCHSKKAKRLEGGLHLDTLQQALKGGDSGPALAPGKPDASLLIQAIRYDGDYKMPPAGKLSAAEIRLLEEWVQKGAAWTPAKGPVATKKKFNLEERVRKHWAWRPIASPAVPKVRNAAWPMTAADHFILRRLEQQGMTPAAAADRRTLIRRLSIDLIGLPPSVEEVNAFVNDKSKNAYEKLVDRLLKSSQFGERWARHWLDLVRYAESRGHEFDYNTPNAHVYRDYVIRALNADVPYDKFVTEHLAGDLLEKPRRDPQTGANESVIGTGFWYLGEWCHSPVDTRKDEADRQDNMVDVFGKTFLAMTIACARCHDHKFDAIPQSDYYAMLGYLQSSAYRLARIDTAEHNRKISRRLWELRRKSASQLLTALRKPLLEATKKVLDAADTDPQTRELLKQVAFALNAQESNVPRKDVIVDYAGDVANQWLVDGVAFGDRPLKPGELMLEGAGKTFQVTAIQYAAARTDSAFSGLKLAKGAMNDAGRIAGWVRAGRTIRTPTFEVKSGTVHYLVRGAGHALAAVDSHYMVNGPLHGEVVKSWNDAGGKFQWISQDLSRYRGHRIHLQFTPKNNGPRLEVLQVVQSKQRPSWVPLAGEAKNLEFAKVRRQLKRAMDGDASRLLALLVERRKELLGNAAKVLSKPILDSFQAAYKKLTAEIRNESRVAMAMWDGTAEDEYLFIRGNHKNRGPIARRQLLTAVVGKGKSPQVFGSGRRQLAEQMVQRSNPLTSRVMVNRVWHHLFGRGIVPSVDNFGVLGEPPTHPQLLDHLAAEFMKNGWSLKRLIRRLVLSRTYRMSSVANPKWAVTDPGNIWLHRMRIRRMDAEVVRDSILAISGRLDRRMGGPSVPVHLTSFMTGRGRPRGGPLDGKGRRSIYISIRRNFLSPMMLAFDMPQPFSSMGRRTVSNVPAQALILMNDPFVIAESKRWAGNLLKRTDLKPEARIKRMYRMAFSRPPTKQEIQAAREFLAQQVERYGQPSQSFATSSEAWADLCHVMLNVKEFVFVR